MNARFLSAEQKFHAVQRLAENRTGIRNAKWKWDQVWEALLDVKIWIIVVFNVVINIPNGGLVTFGSIIINDLDFSSLDASLLTMPFGVLATSGAWFFSYIAARWHNRRTLVACIALLLPILGTSLVYGLPKSNIAGQMVGLYFMYFYWPPYVIGIWLPQANTAVKIHLGEEVKSLLYTGNTCKGATTVSGKQYQAPLTILTLGALLAAVLPQLTPAEADKLRAGAGYTHYTQVAGSDAKLSVPPENNAFIPAQDEAAIRRLLRETLPALADRPLINRTMCWVADTGDTEYVIDFVPNKKGVMVVSGDSGHAFKILPVVGG
ncbi:Uu.00g039990.m01.CDS01 [Anthostomella pinea]|uniref:Uu.00g039990.m01.CDS01 n=1 Tax=Anthostomella pinea TaxID=933095 RepID=A0AAI8VB53_9PEZI|nr:Uu.00g039990.m01.CDS01 [Anthostomella pinea]